MNADVIARGLSAFNPEGAAIQAGRIISNAYASWPRKGATSRSKPHWPPHFAPWIAKLRKEQGYVLSPQLPLIPGPELAIGPLRARPRRACLRADDIVRRR